MKHVETIRCKVTFFKPMLVHTDFIRAYTKSRLKKYVERASKQYGCTEYVIEPCIEYDFFRNRTHAIVDLRVGI